MYQRNLATLNATQKNTIESPDGRRFDFDSQIFSDGKKALLLGHDTSS
jgi:hypothetical protein